MWVTRRNALKSAIAAGVGVATGRLAYGVGYERHRLALIQHEVPVIGLPPALDGFRIGLITDIHHSATVSADHVARAAELLRRASPDLIVLGGDYVTFGDRAFVEPVAELLAPLAGAPHGSFAVLGNHDDDRDMPSALARRGFTVLKDQRTTIVVRNERVDVVGIRFWTRRTERLTEILQGSHTMTMLLAHDPRRLPQAAALDVPLVLSGHTHGGQVMLPGLGALAAREFPVLAGLAREGSTSLFVSRGVGTVYLPVRINCPPDVAILTVRTTFGIAGATSGQPPAADS
ncbi:MAG: metallophosphoesterase [Acidobacteriota bacterium]